jgi:ketosteroid isomerase-like protein
VLQLQNLNAAQLREMVEQKYFSNVDNNFLESVIDCFQSDATLTIQTADIIHSGTVEIRRMFSDFFESYERIWHGEFETVVDVESQKVAIQFVATRDTFDGAHQRATNCNFFEFNDGKIASIVIYMSDKNPLV